MADVPLLIISGTVGVGKTSIGYAASSILSDHRIPHAFVERDALSTSWPPMGRFNDEMTFRNLRSVWANFREAGAERLIFSGVVESHVDLDLFRSAIDGAQPIVVWLRASREVREARLRAREEGESLDWHLARTVELESIIEQAAFHDRVVWNEDRSITSTARAVLDTVGWVVSDRIRRELR